MHVQRDAGEPAPIEKVGPDFYADDKACGVPTGDEYYYDDLGDWWYDYTSCHCEGEDACVLITDGDWGGLTGINYGNYAAVVEGGSYLTDLSEGDTGQGDSRGYTVINAILHELGHGIISANVDEHKVYNTYQGANGNWGRTAMETAAVDISENICNESIHSASQEATGYSECAEDKM